MVPEAYRKKFRSFRKEDDQTHFDSARQKETLFTRWYISKSVTTFDELKELMVEEEFNRSVRYEVKKHLENQKTESLFHAATIADTYAANNNISSKTSNKSRPPFKGQSRTNNSQVRQFSNPSQNSGPSKKQPDSNRNKSDNVNTNRVDFNVPTCGHCGKRGHVMSNCFKLARKREQEGVTSSNELAILERPPQEIVYNQIPENSDKIKEEYLPFVSEGFVSICGDSQQQPVKIKMLRDTGATQSLLLESVLPLSEQTSTGANVLIQGVECGYISVPLHKIYIKSDLVSGDVTVGIRPTLPVKGVSFLLGNDLAGDRVIVNPIVLDKPSDFDDTEQLQREIPNLFPACAVTRAMSKKLAKESEDIENRVSLQKEVSQEPPAKRGSSNSEKEYFDDLHETFMGHLDNDQDPVSSLFPTSNGAEQEQQQSVPTDEFSSDALSREQLLNEQGKDPELISLISSALTEEDAKNVPVCFYLKGGILMRKWRPPDKPANEEWRVFHQIVVPKVYRTEILSMAHETPFSGHLGVNKTYNRILSHLFWPKLRNDVANFCRTCHTCQMVGKPNQKIPTAPLKPIPAFEEPFSRVIIDCVGPLPKTKSGHQYLLTIMCASTRFPEAIPLRNIKAPNICKALTKFFTLVGLPKSVQSDQGSNFMSKVFQQSLYQLGIEQVTSSAYHPQSQGALERFHQTMKNMIRTYCYDNEKDWDEGIHFLMFAARESVQESLGFSPFELVFGHTVRGPLKMMKEKWLNESEDINLLDYVSKFRYRLHKACEVAKENMKESQNRMKTRYDKGTKERKFSPGDKVLVFLPVTGRPLQARYFGPYVIEKKISDTDYIVLTPGRRKSKRLCHINMIKEYHERNANMSNVNESRDVDNVNDDASIKVSLPV